MNNFSLAYRPRYYLTRPWAIIEETYRNMKWVAQRGLRGYADCDVWSLDSYLCGWLPGALEQLIGKKHGHPIGMTRKGWDSRLKRMKQGFIEAQKLMDLTYHRPKEAQAAERRMQRDLSLFIKHFLSLWD